MERAAPISRRERPAKAPLSQETIVDAAMILLDAEGLDRVSMRRVAQALDTGPASLYVYVRNRDELVALLIERVAGEIEIPAIGPDTDWRQPLIDLMLSGIQELGRHSGVALAIFATVPTGPNSLALTEAMLDLLARAGLNRRARAWAMDLLALYLVAAGTEQAIRATHAGSGADPEDLPSTAGDAYAGLPPDRYPHLTELEPDISFGTAEQRMRWSINVLINGILATAPES